MQEREEKIDVNSFARRHIGPNENEVAAMLSEVGFESIGALIDAAVPKNIRLRRELDLPEPKSETEALAELRAIAQKNKVVRSFIGAGYSDSITPSVIQRNILENPGWYTAYTPYQAEIAQGRLEALLNFQQMIIDLTALDIANASMLDEATAAAEAMSLCHAVAPNRKTFLVADNCHPQTIAVVQTRAKPLGIEIKIGDYSRFKFDESVFGALVQYPATDGAIYDYAGFVRQAHDPGALVVVAADILAMTLLKPPGEFGADVAVGNTQRFGVPLGFGGWVFHMTPKVALRIDWHCKRGSNTSVATKRPATSARLRFFSRSLPRCMRFIMDPKDCARSPSEFTGSQVNWQMVCALLAARSRTEIFSTQCSWRLNQAKSF